MKIRLGSRRFVFIAGAVGALAALAPLAGPLGAQVGYPPSESPYRDLQGRQVFTIAPSWVMPGDDPAGVGPGSGLMVNGRYELFLTGPLWLVTRIGYAPGLERTIKDPEVTGPARIVGTTDEPLVLADVGFGLNLTGNKSWHRVTPRVLGGLGVASTFRSGYDLGGYRFGTKFVVSYGLGARISTGSAWEINTEFTHMFWQMKYPDSYGGDGSATDESILGGKALAPWKGNFMLSIGLSRYFGR